MTRKEAFAELRTIGEKLIAVADFFSAEGAAEQPQATPPTKEEVRKMLAGKSGQGYTAEVKTLLTKYGDGKLSGVPESSYAALMAEAEGIGDA